MGMERISDEVAAATKHDMMANIRKREQEEKQQNSHEASNDQEVILNSYLRQT